MDWIYKFSETEKLFDEIFLLLKEESFDKSQVVKVFASTSLSICIDNLGAIVLLIQNDYFYEVFMIFRHQIELMFRLNWIINAPNDEEKKKRTNKIEADSFRSYEDEINILKQMKNRNFFNENHIIQMQKIIYDLKKNNPQLIESNKFMGCGKNIEMAGDFREKYYHQFRFLSMLSHPNPLSRDYFFKTNFEEDVFREPFENSCNYTMKVLNENLNKIITLLGEDLKNFTKIKKLQILFNGIDKK
ncbi:MAG TPA: hypothetical protein ENK03_00650 [Candidatus Cloacimonetes bacterium]|nr:hypothetical protein [Candidatus Cloacimonadota bacterium]